MFFTLPPAAFSESGIIKRVRGAGAGSGDAGCRIQTLLANKDQLRAASFKDATVAGPDSRDRADFRHRRDTQDVMTADGLPCLDTRPESHDFCKPQEIAPRGETRLDGAKNNNVSLHAQGRTARNPSECASSSPRSWPIGHDPRSVHTATSLPPNRSQMAAQTARPHVRPSCNDHLAR
ncbi:MAG: hypothetical protein R3D62_09300 [Xanthobacteraceae bacterium]